MEAFQESYVRAVGAAAGCVFAGRPDIDEGTDVAFTHRSTSHTALGDNVARVEIQMKATGAAAPSGATHVSATMTRDRYNFYATSNPTVHRIVVIMVMPSSPAHWSSFQPNGLTLRHSAYWVNLAGVAPSQAKTPTVSAPVSQPFDDVAFCDMMERIGQGGAP
jgi:hypothetical protein